MTDRAVRVLRLAEEAANSDGHSSVEPEHLLFGLVEEHDGLAAKLLASLGVDRAAIAQFHNRGAPAEKSIDSAHPSSAFNLLQLWSQEELIPLQHKYVGTEHLLLALTRVCEGRCPKILASFNLDGTRIRNEVYAILGHLA